MKILNKIYTIFLGLVSRIKNLSHKEMSLSGFVLGILVGGFFVFNIISGPEVIGEISKKERLVSVASVLELSSKRGSLPLIGTVTSVSEAIIRSESSGEIVGLYRKLGENVSAGTIIAEIENSREKALVSQAEASVAQAEASARISEISGGREKQLLDESRLSALNTILSAYDTVDDSIATKIDPMFVDPNLSNPKFIVSTPNSQLIIDINFEKLKISTILANQKNRGGNISTQTNLKTEIEKADSELREVKNFVDDVITALNQAVPSESVSQSEIDTFKTTASQARSSLNGSLSSLSLAKDNLTAKEAQFEISQKQSGGPGITTSEASLQSAKANLRIARVNLEKTIIRSPITGTINSLSIERGDFVPSFQEIAVVSNNNALEIKTFITEEDAREIKVGARVLIGEDFEGIVTRIPPALDPKTKKIEIRIGISENKNTLKNGASVSIKIEREVRQGENNLTISVPISAIKITADGPVVFTVEKGLLKSHEIVEGPILGENIIIESGVTPEMVIVTDARGLKEGSEVDIRNN